MKEGLSKLLEEIAKDAEQVRDDPTAIFDFLDTCQIKMEDLKNVCKKEMVERKKQEHFKTLLDKKNLGIR